MNVSGSSLEVPETGRAFPDDLAETLWRYFERDREQEGAEWARPSSLEQLKTLIGEAYGASLRAEEGRPVRVQILFDVRPAQMTIRLDRPLDYQVSELVRLSPTIGIGTRWLLVSPESAADPALRIHGICDPALSPNPTSMSLLTRWAEGMGLHVSEVAGLALSVFGPGWIRVATWAQRFFELRDCTIRFPFTIHQIALVERWYVQAAHSLAPAQPTIAMSLLRRIWGALISKVRDGRHGGCLLVVPDAVPAETLPLRIAYPTCSVRLQEVVRARMAVEPALSAHVHGRDDIARDALDEAHFLERDVSRATDLLAGLAAVDGAVVLHRDLRVVGFGAEIVNSGAPSEAECVAYGEHPTPGEHPAERPLAAFGMRHRSAYRLCEQLEGAMAFVVSQDGDVRLFCNEGGRVQLYEGSTPEDYLVER